MIVCQRIKEGKSLTGRERQVNKIKRKKVEEDKKKKDRKKIKRKKAEEEKQNKTLGLKKMITALTMLNVFDLKNY